MNSYKIRDLLASEENIVGICLDGWVRTKRESKDVTFIEINDGTCLANLQVVYRHDELDEAMAEQLRNVTTGLAVQVKGDLEPSQGQGQKWELVSKYLLSHAAMEPDYPLQKKRHSDEFLRQIAHLRPRTNKYGAMTRIRSQMAWAIHDFFRQRDFFYVHSPIITGSDCEGGGSVFRVTTLPEGQKAPLTEDFFGRWAGLTVSGQLEAELMAMALSRVYTFGPTFRAENSNTARHAAEFWMVEPEAAFYNLSDILDLSEEMIRYLIAYALNNCQKDLELFDNYVEKGLLDRLEKLQTGLYHRLTYKEAMDWLLKSHEKFEIQPYPGSDLASEHEKYLCQSLDGPVSVYEYPKAIKPFYMRLSDDRSTVSAMDVLMPKVGELIGGSQREHRLELLIARLHEQGLSEEDYWWYLDSRRWGSAEHSGFGLGFDRLLMLITGVNNIRDVQAFPRTPKSLEF
ncbi:MAG: asparagine--tRNA ligase [Deltaproteobacteria bacterium]|jgi:asparaginyl-tRNA synthetase|nr:asparagine--tRNA ligase [Deltaproteobacteria bacterium]